MINSADKKGKIRSTRLWLLKQQGGEDFRSFLYVHVLFGNKLLLSC